MRLTDANVVIRPRTQWQAIDLGVRMAARQRSLLWASGALTYLPLLALLSYLFWQQPYWVALIIWWLKPLLERVSLLILSTDVFAQAPNLRQVLKATPKLLKPQLLASLTWRRLSPTRSFDLPVLQLEQLGGAARKKRIHQLHHKGSAAAVFLTLFGVHLELLLYFSLMVVLWFFIPHEFEEQLDWVQLISADQASLLWLEHFGNVLYVLVLILWQPIYIACGFSLYLNRRTELEGWDIELRFRRLRQRIVGSAYAVLLALGLNLSLPTSELLAAPTAELGLETDQAGPTSARLLSQPLDSQRAHEKIKQITEAAPFSHPETVTRWRLKSDREQGEAEQEPPSWLKWLIERLLGPSQVTGVAKLLELVLWSMLIAALSWLIWQRRRWLNTFVNDGGKPQLRTLAAPKQLFGLRLEPHTLPEDLATAAEQLWSSQPREALSLLYRGLLSRLVHHYQLPLRDSHTEGEVLLLVEQLEQESLKLYASHLTHHWQQLAYGQQLLAPEIGPQLCRQWRQLTQEAA